MRSLREVGKGARANAAPPSPFSSPAKVPRAGRRRYEKKGSREPPDSRHPLWRRADGASPEGEAGGAERLPTPGIYVLKVAFITVGDTSRLTGGYLYHARVFDRLGKLGFEVAEVVPCGALVDEQKAGVSSLAALDPREYDAVVVDALARVVCAPFVEKWREHRPFVAMVHELPSVASPEGDVEEERGFEDALLSAADFFIAVSGHGKSLLEERGVPSGRIRVVPPGFDALSLVETARRAVSRAKASPNSDEIFHRKASTEDGGERGSPPGSEALSRGSPSRSDVARSSKASMGEGDARKTPDARREPETGVRTPGDSHDIRDSASEARTPIREPLRAICVAQWIPRKGILELVEAWRSLKFPSATLHLIGETDADPEYRSRVMEAIGGEASISVSGKLDDGSLATAYAESDAFILPSRFEGYGIVFAEALSFGLPVVACDVGPVPELVGEEAGIFVARGDVEGLARAIQTLLSDGNLRRRMSEAALRRVESLPRWDDTARGFANVLREAVYG